jgi:hypothetical protein
MSPYKNWAFRGHPNAAWQLWSKISRQLRDRRVDAQRCLEQEVTWIF